MNWITCQGCGLKHSPRPDGLCPRCRTRTSPAGAQPGADAPSFPGAAHAFPDPSSFGTPDGGFQPGPRARPGPLPTTPVGMGAAAAVTVGSLVSRTFSTWWANVTRFALLLLLAYVPIIVAGVFGAVTFGAGVFKQTPGAPPSFPPGLIPIIAIAGLATLVAGLVLFGGMTWGALQHLAGRPATLGAMVGAGLRRAWPLFLVGLAAYLLILLGFVALIVPGILLALALSVTLPVVVAEESGGVGAAFRRSFALTRGNRGAIFGAGIVLVLAMWGASLVGNLATVALASHPLLAIVGVVLSLIIQIAMTPLTMVLSAVAYHDLRVAKEGADTSTLVQVFE
jgi:hypothetical protein